MCTHVTETLAVTGSAKGPTGWIRVTDASVYFDHPVHALADHTLNVDLRRPADVRAHDVVGATELWGPSMLMVGKRQPERRQLELVQQPAQPHMPGCIRVPLGQYQDGTAPARGRRVGKKAGVHDVVLGMRSGDRA